MSKLLILSDLQLDSNPPRDHKSKDGRSTRFAENLEIIQGALREAMDAGAEGWIFPGDLTEHKNPNSLVMDAAAGLFRYVMDRGGFVYGIAGNHDGGEFSVSSSSLAPLARMGGDQFRLFHKVEYDARLRMLAVPYIHRATPQEIAALIDAAYAANPPIGDAPIFATIHYGVTGAVLGAANTVLHGDYLDAETLLRRPLDVVLAGHIHKAQELSLGDARVYFPGSPVICNMGERTDRKTWLMLDTETRQVEVHEIKQRRKWVSVPWPVADAPWSAGDIVAITGEHPRDVYPKAVIAEAIKSGTLPEPFHITFEAKPQREERVSRANVSAEEGLREGMRKFVQENYTRASDEPGQVGAATALAMDTVMEAGGATYCTEIRPDSIGIRGFTTIRSLDYRFTPGQPLLVLGMNGIGKSNFQAALFWAQTGELPNGMGLAEAVNREMDSCSVTVEYVGRSPEHAESRFRITRSVRISKDGAAKGSLNISRLDPVTGEWDEKTMNDGGERDRQGRLNLLLGGSAAVQRIANFSIQDDADAFIKAHPKVRKAVIGEVTGQDPLKKAHKKLDDGRRDAARALEDGKQRLAGVMAVAESAGARLETLTSERTERAADEVRESAAATHAETTEGAAKTTAATAASAVTTAEAALAAIPETASAVAAARTALETYQSGYAAKQSERRTDYEAAKAQAEALTTEIAALAVPDPAEVERLRLAAEASAGALTEARAAHGAASTAHATATAQADSATRDLDRVRGELERLPAEVAAVDIAALEAAVAAQDAEVKGWVSHLDEDRRTAHEENVKTSTLEGSLETLRIQLSEFDGKDVGTCSRCGQPVDSKHIEAEVARLRAEIKAAEEAITLLASTSTASNLAAGEARVAAETAKLRGCERALEAGRLNEAERTRVEGERARLTAAVATVQAVATSVATAAESAGTALIRATSALNSAEASATTAAQAHRAAADAAATVAAKQERLAAARKRMEDLLAAGKADKEAHDTRTAALTAAVTAAETAHTEAEAKRTAATATLTAARADLSAAQANLTAATVALSEARARLTAARTAITSIDSQMSALREQVAQVENARIEIKMLTEQAQITSIAVGIVEDFRLAMIDNAIPFLEDRANHWLDLLGAESVTARFTTQDGDKDTLDVLIDDGKPGRALDIACYSGGQKRRVEMAVKRALNELKRQSVGVTLGFQGYDEPTDGLDATGKQAFVEMVMNEPAELVQIITSHDDSIIAAFDHSIRLVRGVDDETTIEEQK